MITGTLRCLLLLLIVSGCRPSSEAVILRFMDRPDVGGAWEYLIQSFEQQHPGYRVNLIEGPNNTDTRESLYAMALLAQDPTYDLIFLDVTWLAKFAQAGWLLPLDDWVDPGILADLFPGDLKASKFQGRLYRLPLRTDAGVLYGRTDLLSQAHLPPPQTFNQLTQAARQLMQPPRRWGYVFQGMQYEGLVVNFLEVLRGWGGELLDSRGWVVLDQPAAVAALRWMRDLLTPPAVAPPGVTTYQEEEARAMFQKGRSVFMRNWPYAVKLMNSPSSPVAGKFGLYALPHGPRGQSTPTLGGWGFGISVYSRHPEAAYAFIRHCLEGKNQKRLHQLTGLLPARVSVYDDPELLRTSPYLKVMRTILAQARPRPVHPLYARISDILQVRLSAALIGQLSPEAAIKTAAQEIRVVLGESDG
ncbi:MAG: ABC transporter substrate-binding protein [Deltaproteobacteria bacterium]|nr:ABC transporter substrate-binding protein [Deltaproteobacteria bacterium]